MIIQTKEKLKELDGKDLEPALTVGEATANILIISRTGGQMKMFQLAKRLISSDNITVDEVELGLIRSAIVEVGGNKYNNLVTGQLLEILKEKTVNETN
jgi:hypothetical protein